MLYPALEQIRYIQEQKFLETFRYACQNSPFYKTLYKDNGIEKDHIRSLHDLVRLPIISKTEMQVRNWDFLCVPPQMIVDYAATSGTLGQPVTIALTSNDLDRLAYNEYNSFLCADGSPGDIYQLGLTLDRQFMAGIAYYNGLRRLGAGIIRLGPASPAAQWDSILRLKPTALVGVPSSLIKLVEYVAGIGQDINLCSVKKAVCIGENIRNSDFSLNTLGNSIISHWSIKLYSTYASTEMQTAFTECTEGKGGHLQPDLIIAEILDEQGNPVPEGHAGEVTITTLGVEGMPLLRYRTGDICIAHTQPCSCGRHTLRLSPVTGRKQQMIKLNGTTMYPPALFDLLDGVSEIVEYVVEVNTGKLGTDEVILHIQMSGTGPDVLEKVRTAIRSRLRIVPLINCLSGDEIKILQFPEGSRKAQRFKDLRKL